MHLGLNSMELRELTESSDPERELSALGWNGWTVQLCYMNSTEVLQAGMVLYSLRIIERLWGSRKFAVCYTSGPLKPPPFFPGCPNLRNPQSFLLSTFPYTSLLPPLLLAVLIRPLSLNTLNYLPAGPTAILFAVLAQYHAAIPSTYKYHIATTSPSASSTTSSSPSSSSSPQILRLTDKSIVYFLAIQLSLSQFPYSILPALTGWLVGHAWRAELLPGRISAWRIPGWVYGDASLDERQRATTRRRNEYGDTASGAGGGEDDDAQRYDGLRRRLEGESRAAAAAGRSTSGSGADAQGRRTLAGQILDRFRGQF